MTTDEKKRELETNLANLMHSVRDGSIYEENAVKYVLAQIDKTRADQRRKDVGIVLSYRGAEAYTDEVLARVAKAIEDSADD